MHLPPQPPLIPPARPVLHHPPTRCCAAGRFAGPLVVAGVTRIATPSGQTNFCTDWVAQPDGSFTCEGPWDQQCAITGGRGAGQGSRPAYTLTLTRPSNTALQLLSHPPFFPLLHPAGDDYFVGGCILYNALIMYPVMAGGCATKRQLARAGWRLLAGQMADSWPVSAHHNGTRAGGGHRAAVRADTLHARELLHSPAAPASWDPPGPPCPLPACRPPVLHQPGLPCRALPQLELGQ